MNLESQADPRDTTPTFRLGATPVLVKPAFLVVSALLGMTTDPFQLVMWVLVCFVSVLVHELGHALAIRRLGGTPSILLYAGGGLTFGNSSTTPFQQVQVSFAGPLAGFVLAGGVFVLGRAFSLSPALAEVYRQLMWVNVGWGMVNLLPMLPLDGGNIFEALVSFRWPRQARVTAELATGACCLTVIVAALWFGEPFYAVFALVWTMPTWSSLQGRFAHVRDRQTRERLPELLELRCSGTTEAALLLGKTLRDEARTTLYRRAVASEIVLALLDARRVSKATELIEEDFPGAELPLTLDLSYGLAKNGARAEILRLEREIEASSSPDVLGVFIDACVQLEDRERCMAGLRKVEDGGSAFKALVVRAVVHFHQGRFEDALLVCEVGLLLFRWGTFAYNAACCLARLGRNDEAFEALEQALALDAGGLDELDHDTDLEALRKDERWSSVLERKRVTSRTACAVASADQA